VGGFNNEISQGLKQKINIRDDGVGGGVGVEGAVGLFSSIERDMYCISAVSLLTYEKA
jgi:hypothetical protein